MGYFLSGSRIGNTRPVSTPFVARTGIWSSPKFSLSPVRIAPIWKQNSSRFFTDGPVHQAVRQITAEETRRMFGRESAALLVAEDIFEKYVGDIKTARDGNASWGNPGSASTAPEDKGSFIAPSNEMRKLLYDATHWNTVETALGFTKGYFERRRVLMLEIHDPLAYGLRETTPSRAGATSLWVPGGKTSGGISEGFVSQHGLGDTHLVMSDGNFQTYRNVTVMAVEPGKPPPEALFTSGTSLLEND